MQKKVKARRLMAMMLALVMIFSFSLTAFAGDIEAVETPTSDPVIVADPDSPTDDEAGETPIPDPTDPDSPTDDEAGETPIPDPTDPDSPTDDEAGETPIPDPTDPDSPTDDEAGETPIPDPADPDSSTDDELAADLKLAAASAPGPTVVADPESPTGYTVQFVYINDEAESVTFAGDIALRNWADPNDETVYTPFEYAPGMMRSGSFTAPMEKRNGYWYYEVPLAAGANQYWFYVDGNTSYMVPDPANHPKWSPNSAANKNAYNVVYVPYDEKQDYEPMEDRVAELPRANGDQKGSWYYQELTIDGAKHYMGVYLPYGYDAGRAKPYKTIYMLHGGGQDESDWLGIGSVQNIMDNLIAEGRAEPAVLITLTTNNNCLGSAQDGYANLFNEVLPFVESHFNVSKRAANRSFAGLSMGGGVTLSLIKTASEKFGYYGSFSSSNTNDGFSGAEIADSTHILFGCGSHDPREVRKPTEATLSELEALGAYTDYVEVAGGHDFNAWCQLFRIYVEDYLWNAEAFGDEGPDVPPMDELVPGATVVADPDSPTGYTGRFVYIDEAADVVYFCGDLMLSNFADPTDMTAYSPFAYQPGYMRRGGSQFKVEMIPLEDGYWYYELPLAAGANQYWFNVDDGTRMLPDPYNAPVWSPNSAANKNAYNAIYVPYDEKQDYDVLAAREIENPREGQNNGTWSYVPFEVEGTSVTHYMGVYLPYGYDADRAQPYKTIYMLHGAGQDESDWLGIGSVQNIMDNLIADGEAEPAVLISLTSNNGCLNTGSFWGGAPMDYTRLFDQVVPFVEANYNVSDAAIDRSFAGLSMGAMNTSNIIKQDASQFGYYGLFSGAQAGVIAQAADLADVNMFIGSGLYEGDTNLDALKYTGANYKYTRVAGAHDYNTWCQLFTMYVRDYLWDPMAFVAGPTVVKDEASPTGYTVQFYYKNEDADTVTFAGDIGLRRWNDTTDTTVYTPFEYEPGMMRSSSFTAPMQDLGNGCWYYEVPLAAGANQYWFYVNGNTSYMVPDPANHPEWSPNSNWNTKNAYNAVYVPYDEKQDFEPMEAREAELPRADQNGTWSYVPVTIGGYTHYMGVYLPYGYDPNRAEPYKTIWMLHGGGQDESDWMGIGSVSNILDNLIAEGRTEPAVLISPTTNNNMLGGTGDGYANLFNVVLPFVEDHYNVSTDPADRSFAGLSMGSMNTQNIINTDADAFGYYGPWSGGMSVKATTPDLDKTHIFFGAGLNDFGRPNPASIDATLGSTSAFYTYMDVAGAHDFNTWCQLFRIYCEDYLWQPEAFGDSEEGRLRRAFKSGVSNLGSELASGVILPAVVEDAQALYDEIKDINGDEYEDLDQLQDYVDEIAAIRAPENYVNQVVISAPANSAVYGGESFINFNIKVKYLKDVDVIEGKVAMAAGSSATNFEIAGITATQPDVSLYYNAETGRFVLYKVGGFTDADEFDAVTVTLVRKPNAFIWGNSTNATMNLLDVQMSFNGMDAACWNVIDDSASMTVWFGGSILGDANNDSTLAGNDLSLAMKYFGAEESDANWFTSGVYMSDVNFDGVVDMADYVIIARILANRP